MKPTTPKKFPFPVHSKSVFLPPHFWAYLKAHKRDTGETPSMAIQRALRQLFPDIIDY